MVQENAPDALCEHNRWYVMSFNYSLQSRSSVPKYNYIIVYVRLEIK